MTKPKKKPKTGDVTAWLIVLSNHPSVVSEICASRAVGRRRVKEYNSDGYDGWYRLAKIVLAN